MKNLSKNNNGFTVAEIALVILTLAIVGVAGYLVTKHVDKNNTVVITRSGPLLQPGVTNFTVKVNDTQTANTLLADLKRLQPPLSGVVNCPNDMGIYYTLQFTHPSETYKVNATGCEIVSLNNKPIYTADTSNNTGTIFWHALAKASGKPIGPGQ